MRFTVQSTDRVVKQFVAVYSSSLDMFGKSFSRICPLCDAILHGSPFYMLILKLPKLAMIKLKSNESEAP